MKKVFFIILYLFGMVYYVSACTTAVISGKFTKDGRPMLWKNRDTHAINNALRYFTDGKYAYVGLVNSKDLEGKSIWIGVNSEGFAIMNSASYNLNLDNNDPLSGLEGRLMKQALANCKTLADFEALLNKLVKPTGLEANFGVIDAQGGAAYYEVGNYTIVKFDANDPKVAPFGYLIRANYSYTGKLGFESSGYIRHNSARDLFYLQNATYEGITPEFIQQEVSKGLWHSLLKEDLFDQYGQLPEGQTKYVPFRDYIARASTSSSVVVTGVQKDENPDLATLWANVGFPMSSIMVPVWVSKVPLPDVVLYQENIKDAPVCAAALQLKKNKILNLRWGKVDYEYININALSNQNGTGIAQITKAYEKSIYKKAHQLIDKWSRSNKRNKKEMAEFYKWVDAYIKDAYKKEFEIMIN